MDNSDYPPAAAYYGADDILELFMENQRTGTNQSRLRYEKSILKYMYYHNWYSGNLPDTYSSDPDSGPATFDSHVFWIGIMSVDKDDRGYQAEIEDDSACSQLQLRSSTVDSWNKNTSSNDIYSVGTMPAIAQQWLSSQWTTDCHVSNKGIWRRGLSILDEEIDGEVGYAVQCPEDLRTLEKSKFYPRITTADQYEKWHFTFYFDTRPLQKQEAMYSLMITSFLCVVLCAASLCFSSDAN